MKKTLLSLSVLLAANNLSFAQIQKAFKINYAFVLTDGSQERGEEAPVTLFEAYVNTEKIKVISLAQESIFLAKKKEDKSIVVYPALSKYIVNAEQAVSYKLKLIDGETKTIAEYPCKLAQLELTNINDAEDNTILSVWYSDKLPVTYWEGADIFKKIPGAVLQVTTPFGTDLVAQSVESSQLDDKDFIIPEDYVQVESTSQDAQSDLTDNQVAEDRFLYEDESGRVGLKNGKQDIIVPAIYRYIAPFVGATGIAQSEDNKYGAIDVAGKVTVPFEYDYLAYDNNTGQYIFGINEKYGILGNDSKTIIPAKYDMISFIKDGYAVFQQQEKYGIINQSGKIIVPANYSYISENNGTHFISIDNDLYSLVELKSNKVVASTYDFISITDEPTRFLASKDGKYGYLDGQGQVAIPFIYEGATAFYDGLASVTVEGSDDVILINIKGEQVEIDASAEEEVD